MVDPVEEAEGPPPGSRPPGPGLAIASLALGVAGLALFFVPVLGPILQVLAVIFGGVALSQMEGPARRERAMAVAGVVLGLVGFVLFVWYTSFYANEEEPTQPPRDRTEQPREDPEPPREPPQRPRQQPPRDEPPDEPEEPPAQEQWVTVIELDGTTDGRSDVFELEGGRIRLIYTVSGGESARVSIYILEEGTVLEDGDSPEITVDGPEDETVVLRKDDGRYYLEVEAIDADWSVKLEEARD
jgi:hypothetical protein